MKKLFTSLALCGLAAAMTFGLAACGAAPDGSEIMGSQSSKNHNGGGAGGNVFDDADASEAPGDAADESWSGDNYVHDSVVEQGFKNVDEEPSSYFSLDRNTASYSQVRYQLENGWTISPQSVRIEELINYFDYDFEAPTDSAVGVSVALSDCPWNEEHKLMLAGVKTAEKKLEDVNGNYVFLIDVSGSMSGDDRLGLAKKGLNKLVDSLGDKDVISIVTYASGVKTVLDGGKCSDSGKNAVKNAINDLKAGGATYASGGLEMAYSLAEKHYIPDGNNRVIIISDGDFNVGISNTKDMMEYISARTVAEKSVYLSVLGVGMGNMRDDMLETLAKNGNGNYAYLDNETEAEKVLCHELGGTLMTVAKDAKAGVTFSDENVVQYRLIGYDTKLISQEEFEDDTTDTGEIGSNLCVAALYEIELADGAEGKIADVEVKYKNVMGEGEVDESVKVAVETSTASSDDLAFIACVAEFGLVLRQSEYAQNANMYSVLERLNGLSEYISADPYRSAFVTLAGKASEVYNKE